MRANATVYRVELEHSGKVHNLDVPAGQTILEVATEKYKLDLPHGQYLVCKSRVSWPQDMALSLHRGFFSSQLHPHGMSSQIASSGCA